MSKKPNKHTPLLLATLFVLLVSVPVFSTTNDSYIINYSKSAYENGQQTWQIAPYNEHWIYFANKNGVLQFNGYSWKVLKLHNQLDVRSVVASHSEECIYVGGINEFGYFKPDPSGKLQYTCISDSIIQADRDIGNIWGIHKTDHIIYAQGDSKIIRLINDSYSVIDAEMKIDYSNLINGVLYIGTNQGVRVLVGNSLFPLHGADHLSNQRIRGILPYKEGILIVTANSGLFFYDGQSAEPFSTGIEEFITKNEVFCADVSEDQIALGTIQMGVILINKDKNEIRFFNENNGLQNNTVLSVSFDTQKNLWAGLDNGIDHINLHSPIAYLYTNPSSIGSGYSALQYEDYLYLGTNRGLFYTPYPFRKGNLRMDVHLIPHSGGQVWGIQRIGDDLFCMHDRGIFLIKGTQLERIGNLVGVWKCQLVKGKSNTMYAGTYDGLYVLKKRNGHWTVSHRVIGARGSFRFFEQEAANTIWITQPGRIDRFELNDSLTEVTNNIFITDFLHDNPNQDIRLNRMNDKIYFSTSNNIYTIDKEEKTIIPTQDFKSFLDSNDAYYEIRQSDKHIINLNQKKISIAPIATFLTDKSFFSLSLNIPNMELIKGFEAFTLIDDSTLIVPNMNGFALLKVPKETTKNNPYKKAAYIYNVYLSHAKDSLIFTNSFLNSKEIPTIPYSMNSIRFEYGTSAFIFSEEVSYQYRLDNNQWSEYTKATTKEFSNLDEGLHTFEIIGIFSDSVSVVDSYTFRILPPWYRTKVANIIYLLLFFSAAWGIYRWDDKRLRRKKQQAIHEKDIELKEREKLFEQEREKNERQIMQLEKDKLEHELKYKSQEMTNLLINITRKNEILNEIKEDINKAIHTPESANNKRLKQMLLVTTGKIDTNIQSDEVLRKIEEEFDLVHNNFTKQLQEKHPDISQSEKMMCTYIKMGLTSKEMAPLLNISIRGTETLRYRLRKKLNLERDESLVNYLQKM